MIHLFFVSFNSCYELPDVCEEFLLEGGDLGWIHFVEVTADTAVDDRYLFFNSHGHCKGDNTNQQS